jgi:hypothetical protein
MLSSVEAAIANELNPAGLAEAGTAKLRSIPAEAAANEPTITNRLFFMSRTLISFYRYLGPNVTRPMGCE